MSLVTLIFDLLTLKLVCESHLRCVTFCPNLGTLGLWVLELFAIYATDGETSKAALIVPFPTGGGIIIITGECRSGSYLDLLRLVRVSSHAQHRDSRKVFNDLLLAADGGHIGSV